MNRLQLLLCSYPTTASKELLPPMMSLLPLRVLTNQYLGEGRAKGFHRLLKTFAAFEVEFVLSTLFRRAAGDGSIFNRIAENCSAELFVNQNPGLVFSGVL